MFGFGFQAEVWFRAVMKELKMLGSHPPSLEDIKDVSLQHLSFKARRALRHIKDEEDPEEWLDLVLKIDCLICLETAEGYLLTVGVDVTSNPHEVEYKLEQLKSHSFQLARNKLQIEKHWIILVDPNRLPSKDWIIDKFYGEVDTNKEVAVLEF